MIEAIEQLLAQIKTGKLTELAIQQLTDSIRLSIKEDPSKGKELGELLSRIKQASKAENLHTALNWVQVRNGFLAIGHKPGGKISFGGLKNEGTTAVLTLLHENEGAAAIGKQTETVNIAWIWFPFSASRPHEGEAITEVYNLYKQLSDLIINGSKIYIHCSAGIHRTGMITYGFLRFLGKSRTEAFEMLKSLREVTADQVGADRLLWADQFDSNKDKQK
jgi:protein-tyrosine phosphatase